MEVQKDFRLFAGNDLLIQLVIHFYLRALLSLSERKRMVVVVVAVVENPLQNSITEFVIAGSIDLNFAPNYAFNQIKLIGRKPNQ